MSGHPRFGKIFNCFSYVRPFASIATFVVPVMLVVVTFASRTLSWILLILVRNRLAVCGYMNETFDYVYNSASMFCPLSVTYGAYILFGGPSLYLSLGPSSISRMASPCEHSVFPALRAEFFWYSPAFMSTMSPLFVPTAALVFVVCAGGDRRE